MGELLTPAEAAAHPRYHRLGNANWFRDQMRQGKLGATKPKGRWFVDSDAIEAMLDAGSNSTEVKTTRRRRRRQIAR